MPQYHKLFSGYVAVYVRSLLRHAACVTKYTSIIILSGPETVVPVAPGFHPIEETAGMEASRLPPLPPKLWVPKEPFKLTAQYCTLKSSEIVGSYQKILLKRNSE